MFRVKNNTIPMRFMEGLRTLTISTQLDLVKTILLNVKQNCHVQNLLCYLVDHVSGTMDLLTFKSNVSHKIV